MFGPNHTPEIHHRETAFEELYADTQAAFCKVANLDPRKWDVFFITGSGTCAIESMLYSVNENITVATTGHFSSRASLYLLGAEKRAVGTRGPYAYMVQYETAESKYSDPDLNYGTVPPAGCAKEDEWIYKLLPQLVISDCVSAFPYYKPRGDMWATVSSKQLGCAPGLSVVCMKKDLWYTGIMNPADASYMSLAKYKVKDDINQTPHTPAITLMREFEHKLRFFKVDDHRRMIDARRKEILKHVPEDIIIGEGPVVTIKNNTLETRRLVRELDLYNNSSDGPQIFLWSGTDDQYDKLYETLEKIYK